MQTANEERREKQKKVDERIRAVTLNISKALKAIGVKHTIDKSSMARAIRVTDRYVPIEVCQESRSDYSWRSVPEKIRIKVGSYGEVKQFPERKTGFPYAEIAALVKVRIEQSIASAANDKILAAKENERRAMVDRIDKKFKISGVYVSSSSSGLKIEISRLDEITATAAMEALRGVLGAEKKS